MPFEVREVRDPDEAMRAGALFDDPPLLESTRAFLAEERNHLLIAEVDGQPAGFLLGMEIVKPDHERPQMLLDELGVAEGFRGRGIGRALVERLVEVARERGCDEIWVLTEPGDETALGTYAAAGGKRDLDQAMFTWTLEADAGG
jgi:ribosomal protein S18 acetylase RimI-like enzyme